MWDLPRLGIKSMSPGLAGRFFITEPPGKPKAIHFFKNKETSILVEGSQNVPIFLFEFHRD